MELALIFLLGMISGGLIISLIFRVYRIGTLRIDKSDPDDKPYMFLELDKGIDEISSKKNVLLRVKLENFIPHK